MEWHSVYLHHDTWNNSVTHTRMIIKGLKSPFGVHTRVLHILVEKMLTRAKPYTLTQPGYSIYRRRLQTLCSIEILHSVKYVSGQGESLQHSCLIFLCLLEKIFLFILEKRYFSAYLRKDISLHTRINIFLCIPEKIFLCILEKARFVTII